MGAPTLMLVGRNVLIKEALTSLLTTDDCCDVIDASSNGHDALKKYNSLKPDIVLIEEHLEQIDVLTLCFEMKYKHPNCKLIVLSDLAKPFVVLECVKIGVQGIICLTNPYYILSRAIEKITKGGKYYCDNVSQILADGYSEQANSSVEASPVNLLTAREREIMNAMLNGRTPKQIGTNLHISVKTVSVHKTNIFRKLGITSMIDLYRIGETLNNQQEQAAGE